MEVLKNNPKKFLKIIDEVLKKGYYIEKQGLSDLEILEKKAEMQLELIKRIQQNRTENEMRYYKKQITDKRGE